MFVVRRASTHEHVRRTPSVTNMMSGDAFVVYCAPVCDNRQQMTNIRIATSRENFILARKMQKMTAIHIEQHIHMHEETKTHSARFRLNCSIQGAAIISDVRWRSKSVPVNRIQSCWNIWNWSRFELWNCFLCDVRATVNAMFANGIHCTFVNTLRSICDMFLRALAETMW